MNGNMVFNNFASSITGNVNKAYILVPISGSGQNQGNGENSGLNQAALQLMKNSMGFVNEAAGGVTGVSSSYFLSSDLVAQAQNGGYIPIQVQYNPSTLSMNSEAGEVWRDAASGGNQQGFEQVNTPEQTILQMDLIFDDMNIKDAFLLDIGLSAGDLWQRGKEGVRAIQNKPHTVKDTIEMFIGAVMNREHRTVGVLWNKLVFWGELYSVSANYTMFNKLGNPIRGTVNLQIRQAEPQGNALSQSVDAYWNQAYTQLFNRAKSDSLKEKITDKVSNFINL